MGSVMSYAMGLDPGRPAPAGLLVFSGFVPTVEGWSPDLAGRPDLRAFIAHGTGDPVISVDFGRRAPGLLQLRQEYPSSTTSPTLGWRSTRRTSATRGSFITPRRSRPPSAEDRPGKAGSPRPTQPTGWRSRGCSSDSCSASSHPSTRS